MGDFTPEESLFFQYLESLKRADQLGKLLTDIQEMEAKGDPSKAVVRSYKRGLINEPLFDPPTPAGGKHAKMPNVSKKLVLNDNGNNGEYFVARKKVRPGDVLLVEKAAVIAAQPFEDIDTAAVYRCHHCLRIVEYFVTYAFNILYLLLFLMFIIKPIKFVTIVDLRSCPNCDVVVFCGYKCRYYAWNEFHRWECFGMQRSFFNTSNFLYLAMRMVFFGLQFEDKALSKNHYFSEFNYSHFHSLPYKVQQKNKGELFLVLKGCVDIVLYLLEHTQFFKWVVSLPKYEDKAGSRLHIAVGGLMVRYHYQISQHSIQLGNLQLPGILYHHYQPDFVARGLYLSSQFFSTSIHPNATWFDYENYLIIKANTEIMPGEIITVQWTDQENTCNCDSCIFIVKHNTFLCKKCKGYVWPMDKSMYCKYLNFRYSRSMELFDDTMELICSSCNRYYELSEYKTGIVYAQHNIEIFFKRPSIDYLQYALDEYKKILHPDHIYHAGLHSLLRHYVMFHDKVPDLKDFIFYSKDYCRVVEIHYGTLSKTLVYSQIYLLIQLFNFCKLQRTCTPLAIEFCKDLIEKLQTGVKFYCLQAVVESISKDIADLAQATSSSKD